MTKGKGNVLFLESEGTTRSKRIALTLIGVSIWIPLITLAATWAALPKKSFEITLLYAAFSIPFFIFGLHLVHKGWKLRPAGVYENGVEALLGMFTWTFMEWDDIESVQIDANDDHANLSFTGFGQFSTHVAMVLEGEKLAGSELRVMIDLLRSRGMDVILKGKAEEWLREE